MVENSLDVLKNHSGCLKPRDSDQSDSCMCLFTKYPEAEVPTKPYWQKISFQGHGEIEPTWESSEETSSLRDTKT